MFSGIIKILGRVKSIDNYAYKDSQIKRLVIDFLVGNDGIEVGESISVNGVCLTVVAVDDFLSFDIMQETLGLTNLGDLKLGNKVNCERSLRYNDLIGGHLVSGHVDFVSKLLEVNENNEFWFTINEDFEKYFVKKGSVTINGVSLTISDVLEDKFKVSLIPETLDSTNLGSLSKDDIVNVEIDLIARYLENLI